MAKPLKANGKGNGKGSGKAGGAASTEGEGPTRGHILNDINARITKGFREIYDCEEEIANLIEKHVQEAKDRRTKLWRNLKADTKISRKVLTVDYKKYALARSTDDLDDEEKRNEILDHMKIVHEAMHPGETVDWVEVKDRVTAGIEAGA